MCVDGTLDIDRVVETIAALRWRVKMTGLICAWLTVAQLPTRSLGSAIAS